MNQTPNWQFYRWSTCGISLMDTVDEMVRDELISGEVANIIMARFDETLGGVLRKKVDAKCSFTAHCSTFNLVDEVYKFTLKNVKYKMDRGEIVSIPSMRVIACKSGLAEDPLPSTEGVKKGSKGRKKIKD